MISLVEISLFIIVALAQCANGNQRIVHVSELTSDDNDSITSGEDDNINTCCVYGNCSCNSLDHALANLTSNVLINITTDVMLSSLVRASELENVSIIGHNNPTVNCKGYGGLHFTFCSSCFIQGITWDGCGSIENGEPGLALTDSSNITIGNCIFQHSKGQAVLLSEVSGDVNINHCNFVHNNHYKGHGAAIHYSSSNVTNGLQFSVLTISDCNFTYNYITNSLVYIVNRISKHNSNITLSSAKFCHNQGVSVHAINQNICLNGKNLFQNNTAYYGAGIYISDHSTVIFSENSDATFTQNLVNFGSGVTLYSHSNVIFDKNSTVTFSDNEAYNEGGAIYSEASSNITFKENCKVTFNHNSAYYCGSIDSYNNSYIIFDGTSTVSFNNNIARLGGAICSEDNSSIYFVGDSSPVFSNNTAKSGGAIYTNYSYILFEGNSSPVFSNNTADNGGAIFVQGSHVIFKGDSSAVFSNNKATADNGGAIFIRDSSHIFFKGYSSILFSDNSATTYGGAICSMFDSNVISFEGFSGVVFRNNTAEYGGATFETGHSDIIFSDNTNIIFSNNKATFGATIFSTNNSTILAIGNPSILFNDVSAKWCNSTCLPYTGQAEGDVITIDSNGVVWCRDPNAFICLCKKCLCEKLEDLLDGLKNNTVVNITNTVTLLLSPYELKDLNNVSIIGYNNITAICVNGSGLALYKCTDLTIEGITWIGCGNYDNINHVSVINIDFPYNVIIQKCTFQYSMGTVISLDNVQGNAVNINHCNFMNNNHYKDHGAAIYCSSSDEMNVTIAKCNFSFNGDAKSIIYVSGYRPLQNIYLNACNFHNNQGVSVYLLTTYALHISGMVFFENNVADNGAGIYISDHSTVIFDEISNVKFINNSVDYHGAAIFLIRHSNVMFEQNSIVTINDNTATNGTIYSEASSNVIFKGACEVTFSSNSATQYGAAIYSFDNSHVTFTGNSKVTFSNNVVSSNDIDLQYGGTIYSENNGCISFEDNSFTAFSNNIADYGAAIFSFSDSHITFIDNSRVTFNNNIAHYCGVLTSVLFSSIVYKGNTRVSYNASTISCTSTGPSTAASAMCTFQKTEVVFSGHSLVTYTKNTAGGGGAVVFSDSNVIIEEYSTVTFNNNIAYSSGGAFVCYNNSNVTIKGNSNVSFNSNKASQDGGAIYSYNICKIIFKDNSTSTFINNIAKDNGGAMHGSQPSEFAFEGNSTLIFDDNTADNGGAFYFTNSNITIKETSTVSFYNNKAIRNGGAGYLHSHCIFLLEENAKIVLDNNKAFYGGAICINMMTKFMFKGNSTTFFYNNLATEGGGALKVLNDSSIALQNDSTTKFTNNSAQYGGAIFLDATAVMVNNTHKKCIDFTNNIAKISGNSIYQGASEFCTRSCLSNRMMGINHEYVDTPPNELKFNDPAICIDNDNNTQCNSYFIRNIMLGKPITVPTCVFDYYNNQTDDSLQFLVQGETNLNYFVSGPKQVTISCDTFEKINIIGNQSLSKSTNFSIILTLNTALYSDWKQISVNLIIELSPCHPGFWQDPNSKTCECYNASDIVFCSGSSSTIKRGYWFGSVMGKPTVTFCPINYCNFTCCESSNGYYHLSPVRANQCRSHRSGTACGNCEEGYTLSFDSVECINVKECSTGQTILVAALTLVYWIVIITAVFSMMHFKVGIGYLYVITYYYSVVDLLLSQNSYLSSALNTMINIISSIAKITPQFLGQFCFITNMSGIDQQFIHYIHPVAISLFLVMITVFARRSRRLSNFIGKGIIRVICCLLLLSYTSLATTSLLLMRPLIFHHGNVDKVYTYVSPDIQYFHGRHLAYAIVAVIFTILIVIGLPLLLALEPFLNSKINFTKVKPLLDQFQGCYKDKYRCFAGYYMTCRLLIITIIIANLSNDFVFQYLLITTCVIMALIHQLLKPYSNSLLNDFDGTILLFLVLVSVLPLVGFFNNFDANLLIGITFILVILPLLIFITMSLMINKEKIKKLTGYCNIKFTQLRSKRYHKIPLNETEEPEEFINIIDDSRRVNATICDV